MKFRSIPVFTWLPPTCGLGHLSGGAEFATDLPVDGDGSDIMLPHTMRGFAPLGMDLLAGNGTSGA